MTQTQQWATGIGVVMSLVFGVGLAIALGPQVNLVEVGDRAPDFRAKNLRTGRPANLADYHGNVVLLNVWATWCLPCRLEMPSMERLHRRFAGTDFDIVAVSIDKEGEDKVMAYARELGLTFDILHDQPGKIQQIYQTTGVPESWVIDRDGVIVKKVIGAVEWDAPVNETLIRRLLDAR